MAQHCWPAGRQDRYNNRHAPQLPTHAAGNGLGGRLPDALKGGEVVVEEARSGDPTQVQHRGLGSRGAVSVVVDEDVVVKPVQRVVQRSGVYPHLGTWGIAELIEVAQAEAGSRRKVVADTFLTAAQRDRSRVRVTEGEAHARPGVCLVDECGDELREAVGQE